ncbi:NONE-like protein [Coniella lustricola]|uniref:Inclusion body clearance protein IML2 n=1 Tax=Coniella lustricola TaxID=2025994 RepID=A0A2T3ANC3_9PEZI|nr:NONE-like protein [Coniella lustricola]
MLSSSRNASTNHVGDSQDMEISDLQDAMQATDRIVNDDIEGAEAQLRARKDSSTFHQLGFGIAVFMRSILGFEKDIMAEASTRLAECETRAWNDMKKAQKQAEGGGSASGWFRSGHGGGSSSNGHVAARGCDMYPPGTEYQLVNAEAQLMGAMVSVMQESLTEGIKGFYKLRKAFVTLNAIMDAEAKALAAQQQSNGVAKGPPAAPVYDAKNLDAQKNSDSDSDLDFVDAADSIVESKPTVSYEGHLERVNSHSAPNSILEKEIGSLSLDAEAAASLPGTRSDSPTSHKASASPLPSLPRRPLNAKSGPDESAFTNPVDVFVHSGANMCFGILLLMISMVPPAFSKLLYIVGFKGDRDRGVQMLWQSTKFTNVNGGVAGLMLLAYYNGLLAFADILPSDSDAAQLAEPDEIVGYPKEQCADLLERMRAQYPESGMWKVEEARLLGNARQLTEAIAVLKSAGDSKMRQVTALNMFELSVNALFSMDWQTMRDGFLRCTELNDWSHGLYYYFVGCAELEMYRDAVIAAAAAATKDEKSTFDTEAKRHKKQAGEYFRKSTAASGRKKFMARQMPFEVFALRKVAKWEARAKEWGVDLADAVGASPGQEMTYLWNGAKRMPPALLERALGCLDWARCTVSSERLEKLKAVPDEAAVKAVAEAALLSNLGRYAEARQRVEPISKQDRALFKGEHTDDWTAPCAHYELAVLAWRECCDRACWPQTTITAEAGGGPESESEKTAIDTFRQDKLRQCGEYLDHVKTWETFVLDARVGMKVQTGFDTIAWLKGKKGWA